MPPQSGLGDALAAMGTKSRVPGVFLMTLGAGGGLSGGGIAGRNLNLGGGAVGIVVSFLEAPDGLADAVSQFRQPPGAEEQQGYNQDNEQSAEIITKHIVPQLFKVY